MLLLLSSSVWRVELLEQLESGGQRGRRVPAEKAEQGRRARNERFAARLQRQDAVGGVVDRVAGVDAQGALGGTVAGEFGDVVGMGAFFPQPSGAEGVAQAASRRRSRAASCARSSPAAAVCGPCCRCSRGSAIRLGRRRGGNGGGRSYSLATCRRGVWGRPLLLLVGRVLLFLVGEVVGGHESGLAELAGQLVMERLVVSVPESLLLDP